MGSSVFRGFLKKDQSRLCRASQVCKIALVGRKGAGKTSLLTRFVLNKFEEENKQSMDHSSPDIALKLINLSGTSPVWCEIWDLNDSFFETRDHFGTSSTGIMKLDGRFDAVILCISAEEIVNGNGDEIFQDLSKSIEMLISEEERRCMVRVLVATKCDIFAEEEINDFLMPQISVLAEEKKIDFLTSSSKANDPGVRTAFMYVIKKAMRLKAQVLSSIIDFEKETVSLVERKK